METATDQTPPKRVRIDPTVSDDAGKTSPLSLANDHVSKHVASLHSDLAAILSRLAKTHLKALTKLRHRRSVITKMEQDNDFVPRSARVDFKLNCSKAAEQDPEFPGLKDECQRLITEFHSKLKAQILQAAKIEAKLALVDAQKSFTNALQLSTKAFLVAHRQEDEIQTEKMVSTIISNYSGELLKYLDITEDDFKLLYQTTQGVVALPAPYPGRHYNTQALSQSTVTEDSESIVLTGQIPGFEHYARRVAPVRQNTAEYSASSLKRILESVFVTSWDIYLKQAQHNETVLALKKLATEHFSSKATENAAMEIDMEPPASRELLQSLINDAVAKKSKKLQTELNQLKSRMPKNSKGGNDRTPAKKKQSPPAAQKAADANKDSGAAKKKKSTKNSSGKSSGKKASSNKKKKPPRRKSN